MSGTIQTFWKNALIMRIRVLVKYPGKICHSASPNPIGCPVKRGKGISYDRNCNFFASKWTHAGLNWCVFSEVYESETRDAQLDGSLTHTLTYFDTNKSHCSLKVWINMML